MASGNVCTVGTFDLPHPGHIKLFEYCRSLAGSQDGGRVIVGVNSDSFVLTCKGQLPVLNLSERLELVRSCRYVDHAEPNPQNGRSETSIKPLLIAHNVRTLVVGSDWLSKDYLSQVGLTDADIDESGLTVVFKPYHKGVSTTELRDRILGGEGIDTLPESGSGTLVVVPCHNPVPTLGSSLEKLGQYLLVDNDSEDFSGYVRQGQFEPNMFGASFEAGALLHAFTKYRYDRYLLLQDSINLKDPGFVSDPSSFFEGRPGVYGLASINPASYGMTGENHQWISDRFPELSHLDINSLPGIQYNSFSASREQIQALIDKDILTPDRLPRCKNGSQSWERIFGLAFASIGADLHFLSSVFTTDHPVFSKTFMHRQ